MKNKEQQIKNKITQLQTDLAKIEVAIQVNLSRRTIFGNETLDKQRSNFRAQCRNIIKVIEFNKRKLEKLNVKTS